MKTFSGLERILNPKIVLGVVLGILLLTAAFSGWRILAKGLDYDPVDFYAYWYPAHFLWQGQDPYLAWQNKMEVEKPVWHADEGVVAGSALKVSNWTYTPANTAPIILLMSPLALVSLKSATVLWAIANAIFLLVSVGLLTRLLGTSFLSAAGIFCLAGFVSCIATREIFEYGQTTLLILMFMLLAVVLMPEHPLLAGICCGIALSKYSMGVTVWLLFLYKRRYFSALCAIGVQILGVIGLNLLTGSTFWNVISAYRDLLLLHVNLPGIHLQGGLLNGMPVVAWASVLLITLGLGFVVWRKQKLVGLAPALQPLTNMDLLLWCIAIVWSVLAFYHRLYDNVLILVPIVFMVVKRDTLTGGWSKRKRDALYVVVAVVLAVNVLPIYALMSDLGFVSLLGAVNLGLLVVLVYLFVQAAPAKTMNGGGERGLKPSLLNGKLTVGTET